MNTPDPQTYLGLMTGIWANLGLNFVIFSILVAKIFLGFSPWHDAGSSNTIISHSHNHSASFFFLFVVGLRVGDGW